MLQDAETGEQMFVDTHDRRIPPAFRAPRRQREAALREALADAGVDCLELATDEPLDARVAALHALRKRRSQLAAGGVPAIVAGRTEADHGVDRADVAVAAHALAAAHCAAGAAATWR